MRIKASNSKIKKKFSHEAPKLNEQDITEYYNTTNYTSEQIERFIQNLDISADAKYHLFEISELTIQAGQFIIQIGKKILDIAIYLSREYPNTTFFLILSVFVNALISTIPVIGFLFGPFIGIPILIALIFGLPVDLENNQLKRKLSAQVSKMGNLN